MPQATLCRAALWLAFTLAPIGLSAQTPARADSAALAAEDANGDVTGSMPGHISVFTEGHHGGWLFGAPHVDVNAGLYHTTGVDDAFFRLHLQYAPGSIRVVEVAWDLVFLPARGATPFVSAIVQFSPLPEHSPFYVNVGGGAITGHSFNGDRLSGWVEATAAYRSYHDVAAFVQVAHATASGNKFEFLFGLAHPLSPYRFRHHHG